MLYDKTTIAVRERGALEIADISLHVIRDHIRPLVFFLSLAVVPLMLLNYLLIGWMASVDYGDAFLFRYIWNMILLVTIEAQVATILVTFYLGQALFDQRVRFRNVLRDTAKISGRVLWCHGIIRGVVPVWVLYVLLMFVDGGEFNVPLEIFFIPAIVIYALGIRAFFPFITELLVLEKSEIRPRNRKAIRLKDRSKALHWPAAGESFGRAMFAGLISVMLSFALIGTILFVSNIFFILHNESFLLNHVVFPLCLWTVVGVLFVNRFLSYLDVRTRAEGWEVELQLRAEAVALANQAGEFHA